MRSSVCQDDPMLGKAANVWRLITKIALILTKTWLICDPSKSTPQWIFVDNLDCWVVPRDIVEPKIVCKNENNVGLSVVLGPPLLQGEATVAEECHQEGDQHSSSQLILLNKKINNILAGRYPCGYSLCMSNLVSFIEIRPKEFNYCLVRHGLL